MASAHPRRRWGKTRPYAEITIKVHPHFGNRLRTNLQGVRGVTSNLSPAGYLAFLFEVNEYLPKSKKLTDFQIAKALVAEFPTRPLYNRILEGIAGQRKMEWRYSLATYRNDYNKGTLLPKFGRKGPVSFRYDEYGNPLRISAPQRPMTKEECAAHLERYAPFGPTTKDVAPFDWNYRLVALPKNKGGRPSYKSFDWCI